MKKISHNNNVGKGIVDWLLAIAKTMRTELPHQRGKFEFILVMVFLPRKRILVVSEKPEAAVNENSSKFSDKGQTKLLSMQFARDHLTFSHIQINLD